ncbi:MAG: ABC transporter permease [Calditrichaeota bacterium]|nr:MAG: ABC transporter permease [Calditrichota bacterium]
MEAINRFLAHLGRPIVHFLIHLYRLGAMVNGTLRWTFVEPFRGKPLRYRAIVAQSVRFGWDSVLIVSVISFSIGLILAMQAADQLKPFGAEIYVANLVSVSLTRELGPMMTAIIIAGRGGSAIAAEIGTMKVAEELDALQTMGLNPLGFLVVPRFLAMLIMLPALSLIADVVGIFGAYLFSLSALQINSVRFLDQVANALVLKDVITGFIKAIVFAGIIASIGCYQGFIVKGGAEGVGKSTTNSVVISIFLIIAADVIFTALFYSTL